MVVIRHTYLIDHFLVLVHSHWSAVSALVRCCPQNAIGRHGIQDTTRPRLRRSRVQLNSSFLLLQPAATLAAPTATDYIGFH
eukprot:scaffold910_cov30-Tisochrysis_lutea.AAC.1